MLNKKYMVFILMLMTMSGYADQKVISSKYVITAQVVASSCYLSVETDNGKSNMIVFDTYNKSTNVTPAPINFSVRAYENGSSAPGCSAFLAGNKASVSFGNPGQLDLEGVVTKGAGDGIRIDLRSLDSQADYNERITEKNAVVNYPVDFASKGEFRFSVIPVNLEKALSGEYNGSVAFVVTYQ